MDRLKRIEEKTKSEIEAKLSKMGDYVKIDYLERALHSVLDSDTKRFVLLRLAKIYEERGMYSEAAKMMRNVADVNITFKAKITDFMKSAELFVKAGDFNAADMIYSQALALGNTIEKFEVKNAYKNYYIAQSRFLISSGKRNNAKIVLERLLKLDVSMQEKKEAQQQLLELYSKLGNIREYSNLKNSLSGL